MSTRIALVFNSRESLWSGIWPYLGCGHGAFGESLERSLALIQGYLGWSLRDELQRSDAEQALPAAEHVVEPALTAIQIALADAWFERGVQPIAVVGRSAGEFAAGYARGALTQAQALELACRVSQMIASGRTAGNVVLIHQDAASTEQLAHSAPAPIHIVADGGTQGTFVACHPDSLAALKDYLEARAVAYRVEPISVAAHSPFMDTYAADFLRPFSDQEPPARPRTTGYSSTTGQPVPPDADTHEYYWHAIRDPVHIREMFRRMIADDITAFLEVGGRSSFATMLNEAGAAVGRSVVVCPSMQREESRLAVMARSERRLQEIGVTTARPRAVDSLRASGRRQGRGTLADVAKDALARGLACLERRQLPHGEFATLLGTDETLRDGVFDSSPFVTSLVGYSLVHAGAAARPLIAKAIGFLKGEMEPGGVWRYYSSRQFKHVRVPPDLDDTCCASLLIRTHDGVALDNRWMILANRDPAGRFGTWMVPTKRTGLTFRFYRIWGDWLAASRTPPKPARYLRVSRFATPTDPVGPDELDPVVNANVVCYLGSDNACRPAIDYLIDVVTTGQEESAAVYYPNALSLHYAIARAVDRGVAELATLSDVLVGAIEERLQGSSLTPLTVALGLCALSILAPDSLLLEPGLRFLIGSQDPDGAWPRLAFYRGPTEFWGSDELTTGFAVEALGRYLARQSAS